MSELGALIDGSVANLKEHILNRDLGYVNSLSNLLKGTFNTLEANKIELSKKLEGREINTKTSVEDKAIVDNIQGIYAKMMKIEQLVLVLKEESEKRAIK